MRRLRVVLTLEQCWHRVPGGTAAAAIGMARALAARADVEALGVAARHSGPPPPDWTPPVAVAHLKLPRPLLYEAWHRLRLPKVEAASGPVDVVHATTAAVPPRSAPLVATIHDLAWRAYPHHFTARGLRLFERGLELARRDCDLVTCPSEATRRACVQAGLQEARVRVVPLGIDVRPAGDQDVAYVRRRFSLRRDYVLWTGTVEPRKNLRGLLAAFARLDHDLDLVLAGPRGWREDLDALVKPVEARVRVLGFVARADLGALYAGARAFCFPSLLEGFGLPVLEAMAQGTPVVTSRGTSTEEVAGDAAMLVDPRDPADIARGLDAVLGDDSLRDELAAAGRARAAEHTWERTAALLAGLYKEVA